MQRQPQRLTLDISWESLIRILAFVIGIWLVVTLSEVLIMLFGVFILVAAVNPTIGRWQKYMSRTLAVSLFYTLLIAGVALLIYVFVPSFIQQVQDLAHSLPVIADKAKQLFPGSGGSTFNQAVESIRSNLNNVSGSLVKTTITVFGGLATIVTGIVVSFYLLLEENSARDFFHQVLPQHRFEAVYSTISKISERMGMWVRGQITLMAVIGALNFVVYLLIGIPTPLPLAIWAGLCEVIPFVGPVIGVLPALAIAITSGTILQAILVVVVGFFLIQQLENHIVVPKVMGRAVGLSPVLVILAVAIGAKVLGLVGAIIAVPIAAIISVVIGEWSSLRKIWETGE